MTDASTGGSLVLSSKFENALRKVRDVQECIREYLLAHSKLPVSVEDIQYAVEQKYGLKIEKQLVDFEAEHIRGMMERYDDRTAKIYVRKRQHKSEPQNRYWLRFISVKELAHLIIDEEEDFSTLGAETIEHLIANHAEAAMQLPRDEIQSEHLAELAAVELLYPFEFRQGDLDKQTPLVDLSAEYEVPAYVIETALRPNYMKLLRMVWGEIGAANRGIAAE